MYSKILSGKRDEFNYYGKVKIENLLKSNRREKTKSSERERRRNQ